MERRVGEIFTCNGKTYQVVEGIICEGCTLRDRCCSIRELLGPCASSNRTDKTGVIFKEVKKQMKIKNNQLIIDIPEGMEIDLESSDLANGIIKFKQSTITYEDVLKKLCMHGKSITVNESNVSKLVNLSKLMNIARYYNGDWEPDWNISNWNTYRESKYYIYYKNSENKYGVGYTTDVNWGNIYFKSRDNAQSVIDNPSFKSILDAIYKD